MMESEREKDVDGGRTDNINNKSQPQHAGYTRAATLTLSRPSL